MGSLVDAAYELVDPTPDVHALFCQFNVRFFSGALAACEVKWSPRMTTCAGICRYEPRSGLCSIGLSKPLLTLRPRKDLVETLLHEMIHAYLFVTVRDNDRDGHGPRFQAHMHRINAEAGTNITIYHAFHAEVANYKTHHWRCEGRCRDRRPFFGWVKRASNRAPSKNDLWWAEHEKTCGGKFVKVAEPKEFTQKRERDEARKKEGGGAMLKVGGATQKGGGAMQKRGGAKAVPKVDEKQPRIDAAFGDGARGGSKQKGSSGNGGSSVVEGGVAVMGAWTLSEGAGRRLGGGSGSSRLLNLFGDQSTAIKADGGTRQAEQCVDRSIAKEESDDEVQVIEVKAMRGGLKGGANVARQSAYDEQCGSPLDESERLASRIDELTSRQAKLLVKFEKMCENGENLDSIMAVMSTVANDLEDTMQTWAVLREAGREQRRRGEQARARADKAKLKRARIDSLTEKSGEELDAKRTSAVGSGCSSCSRWFDEMGEEELETKDGEETVEKVEVGEAHKEKVDFYEWILLPAHQRARHEQNSHECAAAWKRSRLQLGASQAASREERQGRSLEAVAAGCTKRPEAEDKGDEGNEKTASAREENDVLLSDD